MTSGELNEFFFCVFGSCGCGEPDAVAELLYEVLRRVSEGSRRAGLADLLPTDGLMFSYLGWLTHVELIEHGGGMPGWLTERGKAVLQALSDHGTVVDAWGEYPEA
jgi:hypothetical protein